MQPDRPSRGCLSKSIEVVGDNHTKVNAHTQTRDRWQERSLFARPTGAPAPLRKDNSEIRLRADKRLGVEEKTAEVSARCPGNLGAAIACPEWRRETPSEPTAARRGPKPRVLRRVVGRKEEEGVARAREEAAKPRVGAAHGERPRRRVLSSAERSRGRRQGERESGVCCAAGE